MTVEPESTEPEALDPSSPGSFPATDPPATSPSVDGGASQALARLLRLRVFSELHEASAGGGEKRRKLCFAADFVVRSLVLTLLLFVIAVVAWKTLAPLPPFWQDDLRGR